MSKHNSVKSSDVSVEVNVLSEQPHVNPATHEGVTDATQIAVKSDDSETNRKAMGGGRADGLAMACRAPRVR